MPIQGISVGKDAVISFNDDKGPITTNRIKQFNANQKVAKRESVGLDGVNRHINIAQGWEGSFEMDRTGPAIDTYIANLENNYYAGQNIPTITITQTITEADGSTSQFQYLGVVIALDNNGEWKGDDIVSQKFSFSAQFRKQVA